MKLPPLLLFAALLFWGWESDELWLGLMAGVLLESPRVLTFRWNVEDFDFHRIFSFCVLVVLGIGAYIFATNDAGGGFSGMFQGPASLHNVTASSTVTATSMFRWLPLTFFPFIIAQSYNVRPTVPVTAVSLMLRLRRRFGETTFVGRYVDVSHAYFIISLFSAGIHNNNGSQSYFWGLSVLVLWALWSRRAGLVSGRPRFGIAMWLVVLTAVLTLGFGGLLGIGILERKVQNFNAQWIAHFFRAPTDSAESVTAIGRIGALELSPRIVIRLEPRTLGLVPNYLREASYRSYFPEKQAWYSGARNDFEDVTHPVGDDTTWFLQPGVTNKTAVNIAAYLEGRSRDTGFPEGLLPLPSGSSRLEKLPAYPVKINKLGAVLASGPGLVIFDAFYGPGTTADSPPDLRSTNQFDLSVPTNELPALRQVIAEMHLSATNDAGKRLAVETFFGSKFSYSIWQERDPRAAGVTPLTHFLLNSRRGHCEYFATATVLLLRTLGIPARYAVGYYVHEAAGSGYVVRERDGHAWCLAWNRERQAWEDFDTTPASWVAAENRQGALALWLADARSWLWFQFEKLFWRQANVRQYILWTLLPVMAVLMFYIVFHRRQKSRLAPARLAAAAPTIWPGHDSAFYRLENALAAHGLPRQPDEPLADWLQRVLTEPVLAGLRSPLQEALQLHYRYRFDPHGLNDHEQALLVQKVYSILEMLSQK